MYKIVTLFCLIFSLSRGSKEPGFKNTTEPNHSIENDEKRICMFYFLIIRYVKK